MANYYELLEVAIDADEKEIKAAYRKKSLLYHPDRNPNDKDAEEKFKEVNEAYQTLSDPEKRQMYDLGGTTQQYGSVANPIEDILRNMGFNVNIDMNQGGFSVTGNQKIQITQQINITLKDAVFGCEVDMNVPSYPECDECSGNGGNQTKCHKCNGIGKTTRFLGAMQYVSACVTCNGKGTVLTTTCRGCNQEGFKKTTRKLKVKIPAGIQNQSALHIATDVKDRCDIFVVVGVMKHARIHRNGATLFSNETISVFDALIGGKIKVEMIGGECVDVDIPPGTQQGQQIIIAAHGGVLTSGRANHIVTAQLDVPINLTSEQIEKIKQIRDGNKKN